MSQLLWHLLIQTSQSQNPEHEETQFNLFIYWYCTNKSHLKAPYIRDISLDHALGDSGEDKSPKTPEAASDLPHAASAEVSLMYKWSPWMAFSFHGKDSLETSASMSKHRVHTDHQRGNILHTVWLRVFVMLFSLKHPGGSASLRCVVKHTL